jgi:lysozyme
VEEAFYLLRNEIKAKEAVLIDALPWYSALDEVRRTILLAMAFQLGTTGLFGFHTTLRAVANRQFDAAAESMLRSRWSTQTPARALRMAEAMKTGDPASFRLDSEAPEPA